MDRIDFFGLSAPTPTTCVTGPPPPKGRPGVGSVAKIGIPENNFMYRLPTQNSEEVDSMTGG